MLKNKFKQANESDFQFYKKFSQTPGQIFYAEKLILLSL